MSASQQAPEFQSGLEVPDGPPKPHSAAADETGAATDAKPRARGPEFGSAATRFPGYSTQAIVEREASSDDLQPMLDLRFPDDPQLAEVESEIHIQVAAGPESMNGVASSEVTENPPREEGLDESPGSETMNGAGDDAADAGLGAISILDESTVASETRGSAYQFDAKPLVTLPSVDEPSPEPSLHAAAADATIEDEGRPLGKTAPQPGGEAPSAPDSGHHDAAAQRIAAEASATAEALDNLKRLLAHKMPVLEPESTLQRPPFLHTSAPPALQPIETPRLGSNEQEALADQHEPMVDFPPSQTVTYPRRGGFEFRGFFAGFALSWALGAALYVYLIFS
jgi:hypothetical protein